VEALTLLKPRFPEIVVACTGSTFEFHKPGFFSKLIKLVRQRGLEQNFRYLGVVPHEQIYPFMRQSLAVLQPSLFEGWSTTVEEAKSLGKSVLLSALPVHLEQDPPGGVYFDPHDPQALASCLIAAWREKSPGPDLLLEDQARQRLPLRTRLFGQEFMRIASEVIS